MAGISHQRLVMVAAFLALPSAVQAQLKTYKAVCLAIDHGRRLQVGTSYFETTLSELELRKLFIDYAKQENISGDLNCYRETEQEPFRLPVEEFGITQYHYARGYTSRRISWIPHQESEGKLETAWVNYLSTGRSMVGTGYNSARVPLRYRFINCMGEVHIAYGLEPKRLEVGPYTLNGKALPAGSHPLPQLSSLEVVATIIWKSRVQFVHRFKDVNTGPALGYGCFTGQTQKIGTVAKLVGPGAKPDAVKAYLEGLILIDARVDPLRVLRNAAFEARARPGGKVAADFRANDAGAARDEDNTAVRNLNAGLARDVHARNAVFEKARADYRDALARQQAEVAAIAARNAARAADYARQKAAADAAQAAYEAQLKSMRR